MSDSTSKADKQREYLDEHDRLANLFVTDRFAFELERKHIINQTIDHMDDKLKEKLRAQQKEWDRILNKSGSNENRFAMIKTIFWHHVINNWQPDLQQHSTTLKTLAVGSKRSRPPLSFMDKKSLKS